MRSAEMITLMGLLAALGAGTAPAAERERTLDAEVTNSHGKPVRLTSYWGRPTVLFYEDRDSTSINKDFKDELYARGRSLGLLNAATVVAIANLAPYNWFPARHLALASVRDFEKKYKVPILVDWKRTLGAPPWNLPQKTCTVLVLNPAGQVLFEASGLLTPEQTQQIYKLLEQMLGIADSSR